MRILSDLVITVIVSLLILSSDSRGFEQEDRYQSYNDSALSLGSQDEISNAFTLELLGTIGSSGTKSKAIIKNSETGRLKTFAEGDEIDLLKNERIKINQVYNCMVELEIRGAREIMECKEAPILKSYRLPSPLARFKIIEGRIKDKIELRKFRAKYEKEIFSASKKYGVDPYLVKAVIKVESNFNPSAVSPKNAMGIMQLIPATAEDYGVRDPFDPKDNMDAGVRLLRDLLGYFGGNLELALSAYNAGKDAVIKHGYSIPPYPETEQYVEKVLAYYDHIKP